MIFGKRGISGHSRWSTTMYGPLWVLSYCHTYLILTSSASKKNVTLCRSRLNQLIEIIDRSASCSFTLLYESSIDRVET